MAATDTNATDLARAEIRWKSVDTPRGQIDAAEYQHVDLAKLEEEIQRGMKEPEGMLH